MNDETPNTELFFSLTPEKILEAVEQADYVCTGRCLALNSMENRVYQVEIELKANEEVSSRYDTYKIVKFYRPGRWSKEQILEEHAFLQEAVEADLPVVPPIAFKNGETLNTVKDSGIFYALFPRAGGRIEDEFQDNPLRALGRLIARLHIVGSSAESKSRIQLTPDTYGRASLEYLLHHDALPDAYKPRLEQFVKRICDVSQPWFRETKTQRLHGDLHIGNLLWDGPKCTFVDFDDMLTGPAVQDLWLITPGRDTYAKEQREKLVSAYEEIRSFNRDSLRLVEPLRALRMIHFSAWIAKRWEDPAFKRVFVEFGTPKYWNEQVAGLMEVLEVMENGEN